MSKCIGEPVSWLKLERYELGELSHVEASAVADHLRACPVCSACYVLIQRDGRTFETLAVSRVATAVTLTAATRAPRTTVRGRALALAVSSALSAALGAWLVLGLRAPEVAPATHFGGTAEKGEMLALELVRVSASSGQLREPTGFVPGDRFKLLLTCPPALGGELRVRVFQADEVFEPLARQRLDACGNRRSLAGALQLDGEQPVDVCVVMVDRGRAGQDSEIASARSPEQLPLPHVCTRVLRQ